jgi:putative spermidine/putrescine transport system substrate-binding protein
MRPSARPLRWWTRSFRRPSHRRAAGALGVGAALRVGAALAFGVGACGGANPTPLVIGGWGGAFDAATRAAYLSGFDAAAGTAARLVDAPGEQFARITAQARAHRIEWDAVDSLEGGAAYRLYREGLLLTLPPALHAQLVRELGAAAVTPFGFAHGAVADVLVCNTARTRACPSGMKAFYDAALYPQPRMVPGIDPIEGSATAEIAKGWRLAETDVNPIDCPSLLEALAQATPAVRAYWRSGAQQLRLMRSGAVDMGLMWSPLAYILRAEGVPLRIEWLGGSFEPRYWAVVRGAPHAAAALRLLAWIAGHPAAEARWAGLAHASVPAPAARARLPASLVAHLADTPANRALLATPNVQWYALYGAELDNEYAHLMRTGRP